MIRRIVLGLLMGLIVCLVFSCKKKEMPLDSEEFKWLLLDMHKVDGTLAVGRGMYGHEEKKNYAYYNELFKKYGITREEFDSCLYFYSAQTKEFSQMYDFIIDSLNKQLTAADKVVKELKANDSVNYFPQKIDAVALDTISLDSVVVITIDSIVPGLYKFSTTLRFDSISKNRARRIASYFLSEDKKDTLYVRNITIAPDTVKRVYTWSQYADSVYSHLVIRYMEVVPEKERPKIYKKGKVVPGKKEKPINLKEFKGVAWDNQLFRPYISKETEKRLKQGLRR